MTFLEIKHDSKLFFRIETKGLNRNLIPIINHINNTWEDIEYLNYLFHIPFSKLCKSKETTEMSMILIALCVLGKDFYIHLGIIEKLIKQLKKTSTSMEFKKLCSEYATYWKKIKKIRNLIIIHKDKKDFYRPKLTAQGTDPSGISMYLKYLTKEGKEEEIEMIPIDDLCICLEFLEKVNNIQEL